METYMDLLETQEDGYSVVVVTFKLLIALFGVALICLNLLADYFYNDSAKLFQNLPRVDFSSYIFAFGVMILFVQLFGAVLYMVESLSHFREAVKPALQGFLIWDFGLFLLILEAFLIQYYCYSNINYMFDV